MFNENVIDDNSNSKASQIMTFRVPPHQCIPAFDKCMHSVDTATTVHCISIVMLAITYIYCSLRLLTNVAHPE